MGKIIIADEFGNFVSEAEFDEAFDGGMRRAVSRVHVFDQEGNVAMQKRTSNVKYPGTYCEAAGGHVDPGETYDEAAARELLEELSLSLPLNKVVPMIQSETSIGPIYKVVVADRDQLKPDPYEIAEIVWFSITELEDLLRSNPEQFIPNFNNLWFTHRVELIQS